MKCFVSVVVAVFLAFSGIAAAKDKYGPLPPRPFAPKTGAGDEYPDTQGAAPSLPINGSTLAGFQSPDDVDFVRFDFTQPGTWTIQTASGLDTSGAVFAPDGTLITANDDQDAAHGNFNFRMVLRVAPGSYYLGIQEYSGTTGSYSIVSSFTASPPPDDYGDNSTTSFPIATTSSTHGTLNYSNDQDWFRVDFPSAGAWLISTGGSTDTVGTIFAADGVTQLMTQDDADQNNTNFSMIYSIPHAGTYFIRVSGYLGVLGDYTLFSSFLSDSLPAVYTDLWWNPNEAGWGINLNQQGNLMFATLFTYDATGRDYWLVASGLQQQPDGSFTGSLLETRGPLFSSQPWNTSAFTYQTVGTMTLRFPSGNSGVLNYTVNGISVSKVIERQRFSTAPSCLLTTSSRDNATNYEDLWWNASEPGWGINLTHQGDIIFATLFSYDTDQRPMWLVASGLRKQSSGAYTGDLYRTHGPAFNAQPFTPIGPSNLTTVGTMTLTFSSGNNGTLVYTVNGTTVQKSITRQVFGSSQTVCN